MNFYFFDSSHKNTRFLFQEIQKDPTPVETKKNLSEKTDDIQQKWKNYDDVQKDVEELENSITDFLKKNDISLEDFKNILKDDEC